MPQAPLLGDSFLTRRSWMVQETASQGPWSYPEHRHQGFCDLVVVCHGTLANCCAGQEYRYAAGTVAWVRERDTHAVSGQALRFFNLNVREERLAGLALALGQEPVFRELHQAGSPPAAALGERLAPLVRDLEEFSKHQDYPEATLQLQGLLAGLLVALLLPRVRTGQAPTALPDWLRRGMSYVDAHLERGVSVAALVAVCGKTPEHVARSFARSLGSSPSTWINRQRLERAAMLLGTGNREILDICYSLGFNSPSYFYRLFRARYGVTPKQYRQRTNPFFLR